jgi:large subunit ribosomal protein L13
MNTTVRIKASEIYKDWHVIDAAGRPLGRVASEAAILLRGKHKPTYEPHLDDGDFVIIINASQVRVTGRKSEQIKYHTHSGFPGGLKTRSFEEQFASHPERVLEKAVWGMLPGGPLGEQIFRHLKVYKTAHHPHQSQITGSERARAARAAARTEAGVLSLKVKPLRKLSIPQVAEEPSAKPAPEKKASPVQVAASRARARVGRSAPVVEAPETVAAAPEAAAPEPPVEPKAAPRARVRKAPAETAHALEAAPAEPKPRARRKPAAEAEAPASATTETAEEPKKPARRRAAAKTEE